MTESRPGRAAAALALVATTAALLRFVDLGRLSFWYDEVVTMRLARTPGPSALIDLLGRIDATRAPLHPLLLQGWLQLFGTSEAAARSLSAGCGAITVVLIARLGRALFDEATGLWAAALAAVSPPLVLYSREVRMYAWLVLVTCLAWISLASLRNGPTPRRLVLYAAALTALAYSHPLGLLMAATLALASLLSRKTLGLPFTRWLVAHLAAGLAVLPWLPRYFDHPPESTVGVQPIKMLLGLPIGFVGGNFLVLAGVVTLIALGLRSAKTPAVAWLFLWLLVPPLFLYLYSRISHPIFGPERYTLFVAPAYLILLGHGLARFPRLAPPLGTALLLLAASNLPARVYAPDLKADWRGAAVFLTRVDPTATEAVLVAATDPSHNVEVETARYYLAPRPVAPAPEGSQAPPSGTLAWLAVGLKHGQPVRPFTATSKSATAHDFPGLRLVRTVQNPSENGRGQEK